MDGAQAVSMEEAIHQLSTSSLDHAKRKLVGPSGQITVTMDTRALAPDHRVYYRNLHKFRVGQMNSGIDLTDLSDDQWGMVQLDKCHHISTTSTSKDGPQSYRVRICKTCCQEDSHIELGTYVDQESAILVNDTFEILNDRLDRLIVLRVEDKPDLHHLVAKKYDRSKGRDYACILELISERISAIEGKKRKPSVSEMIPAFAKRSGDVSAVGSTGDLHSSTQYSSCSTSSEASDEHRTASRLSTKPISAATSLGTLSSGVKPVINTHRRTPTSGRKLSIGSVHDIEVASNSGSASTIDDDITVTEETSTALRELSSVCYQRLLSPSIHSTVPDSPRLSAGTVTTGTSLFGPVTNSTAELVRSLEKVRPGGGGSALSSVSNSASKVTAVGERLQLGSPFSHNSGSTALVHGTESPPTATTLLSAAAAVAAETEALHHPVTGTLTGSTHKRPRPVAEDGADTASEYASIGAFTAPPSSNFASADTNSYYASYERLAGAEGMTPRKRAATFSVSDSFAYRYSAESHNPIATLTWLASMEECEVDVARSLFELRGNTEAASALFDTRSNALSMALNLGTPGNFGSYMATGRAGEMEEDDEYYDQDGEEGGNDEEEDEDAQDGEGYYGQMQHQFKAGSFQYAHSGKAGMGPGSGNMGSLAMGMGGPQRARSSSMSMIDRSEAAWAILGNTGGYRSRMDPLSMALKKYHERGGSANAAASGFVGIYSPEDRKQRILRFLEKRKRRMWTKKVKYDVRKNFADSRVRVKGRFVKKQEEDSFLADAADRVNTSHASTNANDESMDAEGMEADENYDHNDVDLELLDHLNAQQHQQVHGQGQGQGQVRASPNNVSADAESAERGLNLRLKLSGRSSGGSAGGAGASRRRSDSTGSAVSGKGEVKAEGKGSELKLTISASAGSARRRRNSRSEEDRASPAEHSTHNGTSPSAVAVRLERANLNSAMKPPPTLGE